MGISRARILSILGLSPTKPLRPEKNVASSSVSSVPANEEDTTIDTLRTPQQQKILILEKVKQPYREVEEYAVPQVKSDREVIVQNAVIGLNPIDWKAPDFNFGIPELPYISGRELAGYVSTDSHKPGRVRKGDRVLVVSTDYRDLRKGAYQEFVVANDYNTARLPPSISIETGASLGVAFVAAALSLGIGTGLDFSAVSGGPDLLELTRSADSAIVPEDIKVECLQGISECERARAGDWLAVWGGSSTSAYIICQLARLSGLKTIAALDCKKHGYGQHSSSDFPRADVLVDSHDPNRAVDVIRAVAGGKLRFAVDTVGRETAGHLLRSLVPAERDEDRQLQTPPSTPPRSSAEVVQSAHLVGLTGLPKGAPPKGLTYHSVPIKLFHEVPEVGEALMVWLENLLTNGSLKPPPILAVEHGFGAVNPALDRMRRGEISGGRVVVRVN